MKVIKWAYRHGSLDADMYDDLDEALRAAAWASDAGDEALHALEIIDGDASRVIEHDEAWKLVGAKQAEMAQEHEQRYGRYEPPAAVVDLLSPDGKWVPIDNTKTIDEAVARATELAESVGVERVSYRVGTGWDAPRHMISRS